MRCVLRYARGCRACWTAFCRRCGLLSNCKVGGCVCVMVGGRAEVLAAARRWWWPVGLMVMCRITVERGWRIWCVWATSTL